TFKDNNNTLAGFLDPGLQLEQFNLQVVFLKLVITPRHKIFIGIPAVLPIILKLVVRIGFRVPEVVDTKFFLTQQLEQFTTIVGRHALEQELGPLIARGLVGTDKIGRKGSGFGIDACPLVVHDRIVTGLGRRVARLGIAGCDLTRDTIALGVLTIGFTALTARSICRFTGSHLTSLY